jgi:tRNA U34 5-methylaminomethyl-2-thiouridine-forming methyltransferase MnmC
VSEQTTVIRDNTQGNSADWTPLLTQDGSFTFFSQEFGESFHSRYGAKREAFEKFARATQLTQRARQSRIGLLDVCYGLGYNTAAALEVIWAVNPECRVTVIGLELDETVPKAAIAPPLIEIWSAPVQQLLQKIALERQCLTPVLEASLQIGDARRTIQTVVESGFQADAIFFDPFSPRRCPQLWTVEFFRLVARCLAPDGQLATYSRSASVRSAMLEAGLQIGTIPLGEVHLPHEWSQGTVGAFQANALCPLSQLEQEHLRTRASVPYRDPTLGDSATAIHARHHQEQQQSPLESTSSWRRRWNID